MKTIITGLLSKAYNQDTGKIAELLKNGVELSEEEQQEVLNQILEIDSARVENIKKGISTKEFIEQGYNKAKGEVLSKFEQTLKEKFGIESNKTGSELIEDIVSAKAEKGGSGELTEDAIKRSKVYQDLQTKLNTDVETTKSTLQKQIDDLQNGYKNEKTFSEIERKALSIFTGLNPILPQTKAVADNQIKNFVNSLKGFTFDVQDDRIVVMDKDGKVVEDNHGNSRSFEDIVKETASSQFEFKANNGGSGTGNENGSGSGSGFSGTKPKTFEDLEKITNDPNIKNEDKLIMIDEFEKAQKGL